MDEKIIEQVVGRLEEFIEWKLNGIPKMRPEFNERQIMSLMALELIQKLPE